MIFDTATTKLFKSLLNGTIAAGDSKRLGGKGASEYAAAVHSHTKAEVGLNNVDNTADANKSVKYAESAGAVKWGNVSEKPSSFTPSSHTHSKSQISDFPSSLPASDVYSWAKASSKPSYSWSEITSKPSTFTPASHTHAVSQITGTVAVTISSSQPSSGLWVVP